MSDQDISNNPFVSLFPSLNEAKQFRNSTSNFLPADIGLNDRSSSLSEKQLSKEEVLHHKNEHNDQVGQLHEYSEASEDYSVKEIVKKIELSYILEEIFRITLDRGLSTDPKRPTHCVYLEELHNVVADQNWLDLDNMPQAVFERLMLNDPAKSIVSTRGGVSDRIAEEEAGIKDVLLYLYLCYHRLFISKKKLEDNIYKQLNQVILSQSATSLCHSEIYPHAKCSKELIELIQDYSAKPGHMETLNQYITSLASYVSEQNKSGEEDMTLLDAFSGSFETLRRCFLNMSLVDRNLFICIDTLRYFACSTDLAEALLDFSLPRNNTSAQAYQFSLLGAPLAISCLPRMESEQYEFFEHPSRTTQQEHKITEQNIWMPLRSVTTQMHQIFYLLLRSSPEVRHKTMKWIGDCLHANSERSKLWNFHFEEVFGSVQASDGFMLNFGSVLLRLCKPFSLPDSPKILKVNPTYCAAEASGDGEAKNKNLHLRDLSKETFLVPSSENQAVLVKCDSFNFSTEVFYATHCAIDLGFKVVHERLVKLNQHLAQIQGFYEDARLQGGNSSDAVQRLQEKMERGMMKFLSLKAALLEPETLSLMLQFHLTTAAWLCQVGVYENSTELEPLTFPLPSSVPEALKCIPEFVIHNVTDCTIFIKRFSPTSFEEVGPMLGHLLNLVLVFMGSPERINNPHLRAKLAEILEALMPPRDQERYEGLLVSCTQREKMFKEFPNIIHLVPTLLHVFISIEMTGHNVAFEEKFQYRRPMYIVLYYLWKIEVHKEKIKQLAIEAEEKVENADVPLFLRFINLLINDAIFLLDEALSLMAKIKELQIKRDSGEWNSLPTRYRQQNEENFHHLGLLARFHNVMSNETIYTLKWLTSEITSIFCHPSMVHRIASMLNYFLLHLVGPKKKNLKVKDLGEYDFKPHQLVQDICEIYLHLGATIGPTSRAFCLAVIQDGRSYSTSLFPQAQVVLHKIGKSILATDLEQLHEAIQKLAVDQKRDDEATADAPEEFLDPIMNTLMEDPVILPSSRVRVDRSTIARHLLSDQSDPFNRSPLSMDMVIPDPELKQKIQEWLEKQRRVSS
ncbi:ubiquitin conjugation factor E4 A-like isoform X1 [Limulus polyphemus]|uniref:Ubiquitin conjugation factor E4 A n=1 Tax=Limulus polyphemus TaxID=6850 RepID=A0ABM1T7K9_LIMPO|nr:ubiquitin conjugation factor E4 A-like isoform X1 [Limulus polyphemus]XP_022251859.1 ubiquitin conjugation factor E4 A-like isoform X1 [Limulus polyphemus]XP_022251865.1 ubiquitin conjugation factor E4 A-like isoform X1 [Limulus polyphemus]